MAEYLKIADLDEGDVARIKQLEESLGTHIMAFRPGLKIAGVTEAQLQEIKAVEDKLDVILLVYE
jgi:hypothetical protein